MSLYCPKRRSKSSTSLLLLRLLQPPPTERGQTGRRSWKRNGATVRNSRETEDQDDDGDVASLSGRKEKKSFFFSRINLQGKYR